MRSPVFQTLICNKAANDGERLKDIAAGQIAPLMAAPPG
jgi:hypothetical protein